MIFDLVKDYADVLDALPREHSRYRILKLLDEAIRRDVHFIDRHPTTLFQCLWNTCWWYDCPGAAAHSSTEPESADNSFPALSNVGLHAVLEAWRFCKECETPGHVWIRSLRPPVIALGSGLRWTFAESRSALVQLKFSPDGHFLAAMHHGQTVLWNLRSGRQEGDLVSSTAGFCDMDFSNDGVLLALERTWGEHNPEGCRVWNVNDGSASSVIPLPGWGNVKLQFSHFGGRLIAWSGKRLEVWSVPELSPILSEDARAHIKGVWISPKERWLVALLNDGSLLRRRVDGETPADAVLRELANIQELLRPQLPVQVDGVSGFDGDDELVVFTSDGERFQYHLATGSLAEAPRDASFDFTGSNSVTPSPDGRFVACERDEHIEIWNVAEKRLLHCWPGVCSRDMGNRCGRDMGGA